MEAIKTDNQVCAVCDRLIKKVPGRNKIIDSQEAVETFREVFQKPVSLNDIICGYCRVIFYRQKKIRIETGVKEENAPLLEEAAILQESGPALEESVAILQGTSAPSEQNEDVQLETMQSTLSQLSFTQSIPSTSQSSTEDPTFRIKLAPISQIEDLEHIEVHIERTVATHKYCCICMASKNIILVPEEARVQVFSKKRIYIPPGNRCCDSHLINKRLYQEDLDLLKVFSSITQIKPTELRKLLECFAVECSSTYFSQINRFGLSAKQIEIFTGLSWDNITEICDMLKSMRNNSSRSVMQALVVFLFKLRTGNSNKLIASFLQLEREQLVSEYSNSIIEAFNTDILPTQFGCAAVSRVELIENHTTRTARVLHDGGSRLLIICDGTYGRHQKSSNNEYQRKSYSVQKKVPLCKPFTVCTTDGFIIDMLGPYHANKNDATIMKDIMNSASGLPQLMVPGDTFIVDRGFRDVRAELEQKGFQVLMPALKGKRKQLPTIEANHSRLVTKIRWAVEATHGILKQKYQLLDKQLDNKMLPKVGSYFKIAAFLQNKFGQRLESDLDHAEEISTRIINLKDVENTLATEVEDNNWLRRKLPFVRISSTDVNDFPEMTEQDLKILFSGSYQYKQAISYLAEMMDETDSIQLQYVKDKNILKTLVQSRHIGSKIYRCFVEYIPNSIGYSKISRHFCECANGRRTVGCCSHVAAVIYYLSHARYLSRIPRPAQTLSGLFKKDNECVVIEDDSDED